MVPDNMVPDIEAELRRIGAADILVQAEQRPPERATHVRLTLRDQTCLVEADGLLQMLRTLPDNAGLDFVCEELESSARHASTWATR